MPKHDPKGAQEHPVPAGSRLGKTPPQGKSARRPARRTLDAAAWMKRREAPAPQLPTRPDLPRPGSDRTYPELLESFHARCDRAREEDAEDNRKAGRLPEETILERRTCGASQRQAREALGLSQVALSRRLGLKGNNVGAWERGTGSPPRGRRAKLAEVLGVDPWGDCP